MSKIKKARYKMIMSLALILVLIVNVIPVSALTSKSMYNVKPTQAITESDINSNQYETYYHSENINYTYNDSIVNFISDNEISVAGEILKLKNKKIDVNQSIEGNQAIINFSDIDIPIYQVSGQWNSSYGGDYRIVYKSDIPGKEEIRSESKDLKQLIISDLNPGEYHLTDGTIYEEANEFSPGIPDIGTSGSFGTLPSITISVGENPEVGNQDTVKISIEKRTIGKGDTLSLRNVNVKGGDTAWSVLKRVADENNITIEHTGSGSNLYVSSIDGDGEFDHGNGSGWKYEVNGEFPSVGLDNYEIKKDDIIRLRYCVTVDSQELKDPLVKYLQKITERAIEILNKGSYTNESKKNLQKSIDEAKLIIDDEKYNSKETEAELIVSNNIGKINLGVSNLIESEDGNIEDDINNVPNDFANDLWLQYDFKEMKVGEKSDIYPRRIPQIVGSSILNDVHRPNFNFEIVKGDSISLSTNKSTEKTIVTAEKEGVTIVKVTYDETTYNDRKYGASSSINTAYAVFDVINNDNDIQISTDITQDSYDTIYFSQGNSTDLIFKVNTTNASSVKVTCNEEVLTKNGDLYTAKLKNRSNIIGIEATNSKGEKKNYYKVVDARKIEINTYNKSNPGKQIGEGDTVQISFKGISNPVAKLATIYNPTFLSQWDDNKGTFVEYKNDSVGVVKGYCSQWDLDKKNTIDVRFDKKGTYDFSEGRIFSQWWGSPLGTDKDVQGSGDPNLGAPTRERYFSQMPNFSIEVGDKNEEIIVAVDGIHLDQSNLSMNEGESKNINATVKPENATNKSVTWSSTNENIAIVENGKITAKSPGSTIITAITVDGKFKATCNIEVISKEFVELKNLINAIENLKENEYEPKEWKLLMTQLEEAKAVLNNENVSLEDLKEAKNKLQEAKNQLVSIPWKVEIKPKKIVPGSEVTVTLPNMPIPSASAPGPTISLLTKYNLNIPGVDKIIKSEDGKYDNELIKTIKFKVPEETKPGLYKMTNGHVTATKPQFGTFTFYKGQMPDIDIVVNVNPIDTIKGINHASEWTIKNVSEPGYQDEWNIIGLTRGNIEVPSDYYKTYYNNLLEVIKEKQGNLHRSKYTEYSRVIIALTALGYDPTNVGGYNLVEKLYDFDNVSKQGINGVIFALIALDTKDFDIKGNLNSREMMINHILENQLEDGGFALSGNKGEIDITAMALQALAKYKHQENISVAIDKAIKFLSDAQLETGGFKAEESFFKDVLKYITKNSSVDENVESSAQVLVAINALGIDNTDLKFVKNGKTIVDNIMTFKVDDGGFKHLKSESYANAMATEQVLYALVSQNRLENNKTNLYDMSDVAEKDPVVPEVNEAPIINVSDVVLNVGDTFDPKAGVTATDKEDGSIKIEDEHIIENTVDTSKSGKYKVVYKVIDSKGLATTKEITVTVKDVPNPTDKKLKVGIYTDEKALVESIDIDYKEGDTAYTVLKRLLGNKVDSIGSGENLYVQGIDELYEFDKGSQSGWVYAVNRSMPQVSAGIFDIKAGDEIIWHYTLDLGKDITKSYKRFDKFISGEGDIIPPPTVENEAPVINATDLEIKVGYKFDPMVGVSAIDKEDGDLTKNVKVVENTVDTSKEGTYKVVYEVSDSKNLKNKKEIKVVVAKEIEKVDVTNMIKHASNWILSNLKNPGYQDEWKLLGLSRGDIQVPSDYYKTYYNNLLKIVKEKKGELHRSKYTEYSRVIIALTSLGYDPTNVVGYNLVEKLYDFNNVSKQGINGVIFALIALDTNDYEIKGSSNSREKMINHIIENQLGDGGFSLSGNKGEIDITAMALQALAKYKDKENVSVVIDKALDFLSKSQLSNGGFGTEEGETIESSAQVLVALNSLGMSAKDDMFTKNGKTIVDAMNKFEVKSGGYKHLINDKDANFMATEQVLYSLVSQQRLNDSKTSLYDMSDINKKTENPGESGDNTNSGDSESGGSNNGGSTNSGGSGSGGSSNNGGANNSGGNGNSVSSPKTSDTSMVPLIALSVISIVGIFLLNRKKAN